MRVAGSTGGAVALRCGTAPLEGSGPNSKGRGRATTAGGDRGGGGTGYGQESGTLGGPWLAVAQQSTEGKVAGPAPGTRGLGTG